MPVELVQARELKAICDTWHMNPVEVLSAPVWVMQTTAILAAAGGQDGGGDGGGDSW